MVVGAKVCELTDGFLSFVCGLYVGIVTSPLSSSICGKPGQAVVPKQHILVVFPIDWYKFFPLIPDNNKLSIALISSHQWGSGGSARQEAWLKAKIDQE